jgi:glutamate/tyrosine decarboxylase-like PLP-dependent enzyme
MDCDPRDVAIKAFFLGPQAENGDWLRLQWNEILNNWLNWRQRQFPQDGVAISIADRELSSYRDSLSHLERQVSLILKELENETPKFTPRYIGHMVSEVSLPALLGHVCALLHNPNNTSREVSRVTSRLEQEAIEDLAAMLALPRGARGHFTSGGTVANFEALWRAINRLDRNLGKYLSLRERGENAELMSTALRAFDETEAGPGFLSYGPWGWARRFRELTGEEFSGPVVLVAGHRHFSWPKAVALMGLGDEAFWPIDLDQDGRLDVHDLQRKIEKAVSLRRPIAMVVSVAGTTELGEVDPIDQVQELLDKWRKETGLHIWHHVDAAYGGYYCSMVKDDEFTNDLTLPTLKRLRAISQVDSVTMDPHKLGYVPYACGAILVRDDVRYRSREFKAPYLLAENHSAWASTLEGSRSGAGPTATWLANRTLGLDKNGYGRLLNKGLQARKCFQEMLIRSKNFFTLEPSDLNILCVSSRGERLTQINEMNLKMFRTFEQSPNFSVSKTTLSARAYGKLIGAHAQKHGFKVDSDEFVLLRLVMMNPFVISKETEVSYLSELLKELERTRLVVI